jgi:hypothetical protein
MHNLKPTFYLHFDASNRDFVILSTKSRNNVRKASVLAPEIMRYLREGKAEMWPRESVMCAMF